jgi:small subunit ribosomal protein S20
LFFQEIALQSNYFFYFCSPKLTPLIKEKITMANHKSAIKRMRQSNARRLHNRYYAKSMRTALKKFRSSTDKAEAEILLPKLHSMIDKLAKRNIIHKNKANNLKSKTTRQIARMA